MELRAEWPGPPLEEPQAVLPLASQQRLPPELGRLVFQLVVRTSHRLVLRRLVQQEQQLVAPLVAFAAASPAESREQQPALELPLAFLPERPRGPERLPAFRLVVRISHWRALQQRVPQERQLAGPLVVLAAALPVALLEQRPEQALVLRLAFPLGPRLVPEPELAQQVFPRVAQLEPET